VISSPEAEQRRSIASQFESLANETQVRRATASLEYNGFTVLRASDAPSAKAIVLDLIPDGAEVHHGASQSLELTGIAAALTEAGRFDPVRPRIFGMDRATQADQIRRLGAAPEVMLGSVHAVTETGSLITASSSGSQLGPYASGAGKVILVVGTQKIVADLDEGLRRIEEHALPLEDARAQEAYGVNSSINKVLIVNREINPGRVTVVFVDEAIGF
jgi:L-lactate utilization protein LutC